MPQRTFNPISEKHSRIPSPERGTVAIAYHNGKATKVDGSAEQFNETLTKLLTPQFVSVLAILAGLLIFAFGISGIFWFLLLSAGLVVYLIVDRQSVASSFFLGQAPVYYLVNVADQPIRDERRVQLADTGIYSIVDISYTAAVKDPVKVVASDISDVREHLSGPLHRTLILYASQSKLNDKIGIFRESLINYAQQLETGRVILDPMFSVKSVSFDARLEGEAADRVIDINISGLDDEVRRKWEEIMADDNKLIAELARPGGSGERLKVALDAKLERQGRRFEQNLKLIKAAIDGGLLEPHHVKQRYPGYYDALGAAIQDLSGTGPLQPQVAAPRKPAIAEEPRIQPRRAAPAIDPEATVIPDPDEIDTRGKQSS